MRLADKITASRVQAEVGRAPAAARAAPRSASFRARPFGLGTPRCALRAGLRPPLQSASRVAVRQDQAASIQSGKPICRADPPSRSARQHPACIRPPARYEPVIGMLRAVASCHVTERNVPSSCRTRSGAASARERGPTAGLLEPQVNRRLAQPRDQAHLHVMHRPHRAHCSRGGRHLSGGARHPVRAFCRVIP